MVTKKTTWKSQDSNLQRGTCITGKWHGHKYHVLKKLGEGATGTVYLAESPKGKVAVKVGKNNMSITSEVNVLSHFSKVKGQVLGPSLLDMDDVILQGEAFPFYVMEYLEGTTLLSFVENRGSEWAPIFIVQLLGDLDRLHRAGWVFGDLKPDNLIITGPPARVRWFDVGGTTLIGRSVKEYTEFFDRGYWGLGDRKATPSYDLFASAMIFLNVAYPNRFEKKGGENSLPYLSGKIESAPLLRPYKKVLMRALTGEYPNAQLMKKDLMESISDKQRKEKIKPVKEGKQLKKKKSTPPASASPEKKPSYKIEIMLTASFLFLASVLYLVGQWI
ncbi:protein kinase domain-containing protein [Bacillus sp. FJAT-44742]|uniref:protein kinase domain-containing protein n=1 Tax=Bacillus sp. FJAT-44742 TaxID=2014005 RepID=UPI000C24F704|nr:protein kinase [Bacillus sp. FJAT-44742]